MTLDEARKACELMAKSLAACGDWEAQRDANALRVVLAALPTREQIERPAPSWPDANNTVRWKPAHGCINCGEASDGGFYTSEGQVGGFCSQCWEFLRAEFCEVPTRG